jgi:hypothetical protein
MIGEEAGGDILGKRDASLAVDSDVIVVVDPAQIVEGEMAGERGGLGAKPLPSRSRRRKLHRCCNRRARNPACCNGSQAICAR